MFDLKKEGIKVLAGLMLAISIIFTIRYFGLSTWGTIMLLAYINLLFRVYIAFKNQKFDFFDWVWSFIVIAAVVHLFTYMGRFGWIGFILTIAASCTMILWKKRKKYLQVKWHIESMIWGKPLKEFVAAGEKPPQIKFV